MWTCKEYVAYLASFASHFALLSNIRFNVTVLSVQRRSDGRWAVQSKATSADESTLIVEEIFDAVAVCAGAHQVPRVPDWASALTIPHLHSSATFDCSFGTAFKDKDVVLVGLGESGSDLALLIAPHAKSLKISVRNHGPGYVTPRFTGDEVTDLNTNRKLGSAWSPFDFRRFAALVKDAEDAGDADGLKTLAKVWTGKDDFDACELLAIRINAKNNNHPYDRFGTKNFSFLEAISKYGASLIGELKSADDVPQGTDVVVFCTGYVSRFPFFPPLEDASFQNHR